jgi:PAS domain S-box-containing protein
MALESFDFRAAFEASSKSMMISEAATGKIVEVNRTWLELAGLSREEVLGKTATDLNIWAHDSERDQFITAMRSRGRVDGFEATLMIGGKPGPVLMSGRIVMAGSDPYILIEGEDLSERKRVTEELVKSEGNVKSLLAASERSRRILLGILEDERLAKEALRESESVFESFMEHSPVYIFFKDSEIRAIRLSRNYEKMLGMPLGDILGKNMDELFPSDLAKAMVEDDKRTLQMGVQVEIVERLGDRVYETTKFPILKDGKPSMLAGFTIDITERTRAEEALKESEARYRFISENADDVIWAMSLETGRFTYVSPSVFKLRGYTPEEVMGQTMAEALTPESLKIVEALLAGAIARGKASEKGPVRTLTLVDQPRKDGSVVSTEVAVNLMLDERGAPVELVGVSRDITERKKAEEAIKKSEEKFSKAFSMCPEAITIASMEDGRYLEVNEAFLRKTGFRREEVIGRTSGDLGVWIDPEDRNRFVAGLSARGNLKDFPARYAMKDGSVRDFLVSSEIVDLDGKRCSLNFIYDITERLRAEAERSLLHEELQQAQKMESVGRLAGGVAHDFNNMLGVILGHAEMALGGLEGTEPIHSNLREIQKAAERSADLTRQLLAFARRQTVAPKVVDLNAAIGDLLKMLERLIGEGIRLEWRPSELWPVRVDPSQIDQILANLCVNARDAVRGSGTISISTGRGAFDQDYCADHPGFEPGEYSFVSVADDGSGMDAETRSHIFEPFFTTKGLGQGTGLGLATVYGAVKQNRGFIYVESEPGRGSEFKIYLPRFAAPEPVAEDAAAPLNAAIGNETVLVAEDEPAIMEMIVFMLGRLGYTVLAANGPREAISIARERAGSIDLLLTDMVMPGMNGTELAERVLAMRPGIKRLFMSGYPGDGFEEGGLQGDGAAFIQKPFSGKALSAKIRELLDGG